MTVWWITLIITYILCLLARSSGRLYIENHQYKIAPNRWLSFAAMAILIFVSGFRDGVGDTYAYKESFDKLNSSISYFITHITDRGKDKGFNFLQVFIKRFISDNNQVLILVMAIITISLIFIALYKYTDYLELSVFLFITTGCYLVTMNGIRQYVASAILFFAFPLIEERKWKEYFLIVILCSTIHQSALIFIPLYFFVNQPAWGKVSKTILVVGVFLYISYSVTGPMIASLLGESQYSEYGDLLTSSGAGANIIRVFVMLVPVVLSYIGRNHIKGNERYYNIIVNFSIINFIMILLASRYWIYARFNMYFSLYMIILIVWCIKYMFNEKSTKIIYMACVILYAVYYYFEMYISLGYREGYHHFIQSIGINL